MKNKFDYLAKQFDNGEIAQIKPDSESSLSAEEERYLDSLNHLDSILKEGSAFDAPKSFSKRVMNSLPAQSTLPQKLAIKWFKPLLFLTTIVLCFIYYEPLGFGELYTTVESNMHAVESFPMDLLYVTITGGAIILMIVVVLSNFTSIRSRRIEN
jgi:hypothetical protein